MNVAFIDWISYTRMNDVKILEYPSEFAGCAREVVWEWQRLTETTATKSRLLHHVKPNRPFAYARMDEQTKARIEWGGGSDRVLISFSGEGCRHLRQTGRTNELLSKIAGDVSRIDVSVDILTELSPFDFAKERDKTRHQTGALMFSGEGLTQYVGSWSSDRFARVYRYNPPHERAALLRVEHVFKGKQAKILASKLVDVSPNALLEAIGNIYGWNHANWIEACNNSEAPEEVVWYKEERHPSKTVKWLQETCMPALVRMVNEGEITDVEEWFKVMVLDVLYNDGRDRPSTASNREE